MSSLHPRPLDGQHCTLLELEALLQHEDKEHYACGDYLCHARGQSGVIVAVDAIGRQEMIRWAYKVCAFLNLRDETVIHAVGILDKFLLTPKGLKVLASIHQFKLAAMACLYIVAKLQEHCVLSSKLMSALSRGLFPPYEVEYMELEIAMTLGWHIHPPTSLMFAMAFLKLLPSSVPQDLKDAAYELCKIQSCYAVLDYRFVSTKASIMGYSSVVNALKSLGMDSVLMNHVESLFSYACRVDFRSITTKGKAQDVLFQVISNKNLTIRGSRPCTPSSSPKDKSPRSFHRPQSLDASLLSVVQ